MFIDHLTIYAENPEETKKFYEDYFKGQSSGELVNEETKTPSYYLTFGGGGSAKLEVAERPEGDRYLPIKFTFMLDSKEDVDDKVKSLEEAGYKIKRAPHDTEDGYYSGIALDPADNEVEILYGRPGGLHCALNNQRKKGQGIVF